MARKSNVRYTLAGTLACKTPLHVGGFGADPDTDMPVARDGRDRCYIPGTSLAGPLRAWCERAFDEAAVKAVWGFQLDKKGHASFIDVDDVFVDDDKLIPEIRDGVGIDRETGAAADGIKYDRAVLPRDTKLFGFTVTAEVPEEHKRLALGMLAGLKAELEAGRIRLGASKTRGLGKVVLENATLTRVETNTRVGVLAMLKGKSDPVTPADLAAIDKPTPPPRLDIRIQWKPVGPLMVKAGFDGVAADMLPLVSKLAGGVAPVLPGSSIKGAFRARAEQIVRTMRGLAATGDFLADVDVPLVDELFGTVGGAKAVVNDRRGLGGLTIDDCYANRAIGEKQWANVVAATDEDELAASLKGTAAAGWQQAFHVAVDRWTGGAAESFFYTVLEPHGVAWEEMCLTVDLCRTPAAAVTLLLLLLRDLERGRLPLGFGVNRGMGAVAIETVTITPNGTSDYGTVAFTTKSIPDAACKVLNREWANWLKSPAAPEAA